MMCNYHIKRKKWTTISLAMMMLLAAPTALVAADQSSGEGPEQGQGMGDNNSTLPDMTISDIYLYNNNILTIEVSNIGIGDVPTTEADSGTVYIWINQSNLPNWTYSWSTLSDTSFVNAGGVADVQPQLLVGMNYVKACVDVHDVIVESNENNNCLISNLTSVEDIDEPDDNNSHENNSDEDIDEPVDNNSHENNSDEDNTDMGLPECPPGTSTLGTGAHVKLWLLNGGFVNCYYIDQEDKTGPTFDENGMQICPEGTSYYGIGEHFKLWLLNGGFVNCYILEDDQSDSNITEEMWNCSAENEESLDYCMQCLAEGGIPIWNVLGQYYEGCDKGVYRDNYENNSDYQIIGDEWVHGELPECPEGTSYYGTGDHVKVPLPIGGFVNCYFIENDDWVEDWKNLMEEYEELQNDIEERENEALENLSAECEGAWAELIENFYEEFDELLEQRDVALEELENNFLSDLEVTQAVYDNEYDELMKLLINATTDEEYEDIIEQLNDLIDQKESSIDSLNDYYELWADQIINESDAEMEELYDQLDEDANALDDECNEAMELLEEEFSQEYNELDDWLDEQVIQLKQQTMEDEGDFGLGNAVPGFTSMLTIVSMLGALMVIGGRRQLA